MMKTLREHLDNEAPVVMRISQKKDATAFLVLVSTLLSLRTKDETTEEAMSRLRTKARTPEDILSLPLEELEKLIYPVGFYRKKAKILHDVAHTIIDRFGGKVPGDLENLLTIQGVGRKTANLVVTEAFGKPGICVDTHVHRISNRLGFISTKNPNLTEEALRRVLPKKYWTVYNRLLVAFGRSVCHPVSPRCSSCPISNLCQRVGVIRHR